jgi:hypothetical protein
MTDKLWNLHKWYRNKHEIGITESIIPLDFNTPGLLCINDVE